MATESSDLLADERTRDLRAPFFFPPIVVRTDCIHTTGLLLYYARAPAQTDVISLSLSFFLPSPQGYCIIANTIYRSTAVLSSVSNHRIHISWFLLLLLSQCKRIFKSFPSRRRRSLFFFSKLSIIYQGVCLPSYDDDDDDWAPFDESKRHRVCSCPSRSWFELGGDDEAPLPDEMTIFLNENFCQYSSAHGREHVYNNNSPTTFARHIRHVLLTDMTTPWLYFTSHKELKRYFIIIENDFYRVSWFLWLFLSRCYS